MATSRRAGCVQSWRVAGRCLCGALFGGSPSGPLAHLADAEQPARLPTCAACCPVCQGIPHNSVSHLFSTAWPFGKNLAVPIH